MIIAAHSISEMALAMLSYFGAIERDSLTLMDFSLKTIDSSTHNTRTITLPHRIDRKIRRVLHASV